METKRRSKIGEKQSRAKRIKILLKNYDKTFGSYQDMSNFKEPVVFLMRNTRKVDWFDEATTGWFQFVHTNGETRKIQLTPEFLHTFDYGKRTFKGYIIHEDYPTPLPEMPIVTAEKFQWAIDKTQHDIMSHKAKEIIAKGDMWWKILLGIGAIILALAVAKLLVPDLFNFGKAAAPAVVETTKQAASTVVNNISKASI